MKYNKAKHDLLQLVTITQHLPSTGGFLSHHAYFVWGLYVCTSHSVTDTDETDTYGNSYR